jgi:hypothetical protein
VTPAGPKNKDSNDWNLLAEHFLRITGQDRKADSIDSIGIGNRRPGGVNLMM